MELTKEQVEQRASICRKLQLNAEEYAQLKKELWATESFDRTFRNVDEKLLDYVYSKFDFYNVINNYGDLYFILERNADHFVAKRILWSLTLSEENYIIVEEDELDSDGEFISTNYNISQLG